MTPLIQNKVCSVCRETKGLSDFGKDKRASTGCRAECRLCERAGAAAMRVRNKEKLLVSGREYRSANREKLRKHHREYQRAKYAASPEASKELSARWKKANKDHVSWYTQSYRIENAEKVAADMRQWRAANKDKLRSYWAKWNPVCNAARRANKKAANCNCCQTPDGKANMALVYAIGRKLGLHVDHVKPLAKGGRHCLHNLQYLTPLDNLRKGAKWQEAA